MTLDVSHFFPSNVADACAIWHILSSQRLHSAAISQRCVFSCTHFVYYECLLKQRKVTSREDCALQERFRHEITIRRIGAYHMEIEDLQDVVLLESRKRLGKGEISSIVFAKKTGQAFLTDDQKARSLAATILDIAKVQTTPHLLGWLFFCGVLCDSDMSDITCEHTSLRRPLARYFQEMYEEAMRCRLVDRRSTIADNR